MLIDDAWSRKARYAPRTSVRASSIDRSIDDHHLTLFFNRLVASLVYQTKVNAKRSTDGQQQQQHQKQDFFLQQKSRKALLFMILPHVYI